jgi:hypothetical protein
MDYSPSFLSFNFLTIPGPQAEQRGATGRGIARRERPRCAIGIEAKSCSEFRAEAVPLLILEPPAAAIATMAATNKCLARNSKSRTRAKATKEHEMLKRAVGSSVHHQCRRQAAPSRCVLWPLARATSLISASFAFRLISCICDRMLALGEKLENSNHSAAGIGKPGFRMRRPTELGRSRPAGCGRIRHRRPGGRCDPPRI